MLGAKVTEKLLPAACVLALALSFSCSFSCGSNHRVSPWGGGEAPPPVALAQRPELAAQLEAIDEETAALGLTLAVELRGRLPRGGGPLAVRGYRGVDTLGRPTSAVRVATSRGVVMAVGPLSARDLDRRQATELLPSLLPGEPPGRAAAVEEAGVFASGSDLNGDGDPDVALRSEAGALEIWAVRLLGAAPYGIELAAAPTQALDIDADGRIDLAGRLPPLDADPIAPDLLDVATFEDGRYTNRSAAARAFHESRLRAASRSSSTTPPPAAAQPGASPAPPAPPPAPPDATRLRRALERTWHAARAGEPATEVLAALDRERVPAELRAAFAAHRARVASAVRTEKPKGTASETPAGR